MTVSQLIVAALTQSWGALARYEMGPIVDVPLRRSMVHPAAFAGDLYGGGIESELCGADYGSVVRPIGVLTSVF